MMLAPVENHAADGIAARKAATVQRRAPYHWPTRTCMPEQPALEIGPRYCRSCLSTVFETFDRVYVMFGFSRSGIWQKFLTAFNTLKTPFKHLSFGWLCF